MARNYKEYSEEFKLGALELLRRGEKSMGQIERDLGITPGLLGNTRYWTKQANLDNWRRAIWKQPSQRSNS
jgi:transposase-like protein